MQPLKIETQEGDDSLEITLSGPLDEFSVLGGLNLARFKQLSFHLKGLTSINSVGVREWVDLMTSVPSEAAVDFVDCPRPFVDQMNILVGFVPRQARVRSFAVPYYCDSCQQEEAVYFSEGKEYCLASKKGNQKSELFPLKPVACSKCQHIMHIDILESKYFSFLATLQPELK